MKRNATCPICFVKKLFMKKQAVSHIPPLPAYGNGAAATPPMGWSSWNTFKNEISEELILDTARAMVDSGLRDAGYCYLNVDDCWQSNLRDAAGDLQGDLVRFPSGMGALIEQVNALGLKVGLYSSNGTLTCEDLPASLGREAADARKIAQWGAEYFKYDFCHNIPIPQYAPLVESLSVAKAGSGEEQLYPVTDALLYGLAKLRPDKHMPCGYYVSGLDGNRGALEFKNVYAPEEGEYTLTVRIKKYGGYHKFLALIINDSDLKRIEVPDQKHWNYTARFQVRAHLRAGVNSVRMYNPIFNRADSAMLQYLLMGEQLKQAAEERGKGPIVFSICEWGRNRPYLWGSRAGNLWRTTPDIRPIWSWIKVLYRHTVKLYAHAGPGGWNDPDMLEVGNGKLTAAQNRSHFTLWCMMCAPLILGNDLRNIPDEVLKIVTNRELIALDQDPLGVPCKRISGGRVDVLVRPLADGSAAVCAFNKGGAKTVHVDLQKVARDGYARLSEQPAYSAVELWSGALSQGTKLTANVEKHGVAVWRVRAGGEA